MSWVLLNKALAYCRHIEFDFFTGHIVLYGTAFKGYIFIDRETIKVK